MIVVSPCGDGDNSPGRVQGCSNAAFAQDLDAGPLVEGCGWCQYDAVCHKVAGNPPLFAGLFKEFRANSLHRERLDSRTRKRDTRNGSFEMQQLDVLAVALNMYRSECRCFVARTVCTAVSLGRAQHDVSFCVLHGGVPWEVPIAV